MKEFYKWDPTTLSVKVKEMDNEHIILIEKMNLLYSAHESQQPRETLEKLVSDFANYTTQHFADEEQYMEKVNYPGLGTHKIIHQQLLKEVSTHIQEFQRTGTLSQKFFSFLTMWLTSHIRGIDMKYGTL